MKLFNTILLTFCLAIFLAPGVTNAQSLLDRQAKERADLLAAQKQEITKLNRDLTRGLAGQLVQIRRDFNTSLRAKINEIRAELIVVRKTELAAALNDRMRQRAIDNFVKNLQSRISVEREVLRAKAQESIREARANIGIQLRALAQAHRAAFKALLAKHKEERIDAAKG